MSKENAAIKIVVCGAGPVGALTALNAAKRGAIVEVYDLRDDLRATSTTPLNFTKSINLALSQRGISAIKDAGGYELLNNVLEESIRMNSRMIHGYNTAGGYFEESQKYDARHRYINAVDRGFLNKCFLDALDQMSNVSIHFNHKLTGANFDKKVAWFEQLKVRADKDESRPNEIEVKFDLFIGADGAHSATRYHLMKYARMNYEQEYIDTLWCEFRIEATSEGEHAISSSHLHIWPAGSFMFIAIPSSDGSFSCTLFAPASHYNHIKESPKENLPAYFKKHFAGVCPELISEAALTEQFQQNPHLPLISIKCTPYHFGSSVVILGDAAHAMVPFYGQGMNAGLEDTRILFSHLDTYDVFDVLAKPSERIKRQSQALAAYTAQRTPDAHTINDLAMGNYREMSSNVRSPTYKLRKLLEETVSVKIPWTGWRTQYARVSFEDQRYSEVAREVRRQGKLLVIGMVLAPLGIGALAFASWRFSWWVATGSHGPPASVSRLYDWIDVKGHEKFPNIFS